MDTEKKFRKSTLASIVGLTAVGGLYFAEEASADEVTDDSNVEFLDEEADEVVVELESDEALEDEEETTLINSAEVLQDLPEVEEEVIAEVHAEDEPEVVEEVTEEVVTEEVVTEEPAEVEEESTETINVEEVVAEEKVEVVETADEVEVEVVEETNNTYTMQVFQTQQTPEYASEAELAAADRKLEKLNEYRATYDAGPLEVDPTLQEFAFWKVNDYNERMYYRHDEPAELGGKKYFQQFNEMYPDHPETHIGEIVTRVPFYNEFRNDEPITNYEQGLQFAYDWFKQSDEGHNEIMTDPRYLTAGIAITDAVEPAASWIQYYVVTAFSKYPVPDSPPVDPVDPPGDDDTPTPPEDGGDVEPPGDDTPTPPEDGGDVDPPGDDTPTPPEDGGDVDPPGDDDDTPTPPEDDGDVDPPGDDDDTPTPPEDGGDVDPPGDDDDTPTPPEDGGDVDPPGDDTPTPPEDGGDVDPPGDDDDTPTPPEDGGDVDPPGDEDDTPGEDEQQTPPTEEDATDEVEGDDSVEDSKPTTPEGTESASPSPSEKPSEKVTGTVQPSGDVLPKTGEASKAYTLYASILGALGLGALAFRRKN